MHGPQYEKILDLEVLHCEGKPQDRKQHGACVSNQAPLLRPVPTPPEQ